MVLSLFRGIIAGAIAGILAGLLHVAVSADLIDEAIQLERNETLAEGRPLEEELYSRATQRVGLVVATTLLGMVVGGVLGVIFSRYHQQESMPDSHIWYGSLRLAIAGFASVWFIPFLKYPANPPGVGTEETIGSRTAFYLLMIAVSVFALIASRRLRDLLTSRGWPVQRRDLAAGVAYVSMVAGSFIVLPASPDIIAIPGPLLWEFRLKAVLGQAVLWILAGAFFALFAIRSERLASTDRTIS